MTAPTLFTRIRLAARDRIDDGRVTLKVAAAAARPRRPLLANLIVTRRCNLSCGYCFEYDKTSPPVPLATLKQRIDRLADLGTVFVTLTGGEALLHPDLAELIRYVRRQGMVPFLNTNGFLLTKRRIEELNRAGLYAMQISIDNVTPNDITVKSLKTLRPKLELLSRHARFQVRVSAVLGSGSPAEAIEVARVAMALGFDAKCQLTRDEDGAFIELDDESRRAYDTISRLGKRAPRYLSEDFQRKLIDDGRIDWKCRAGARYFHVCEQGLVHYCSSNHGTPGKPLADYTAADIERAFHDRKPCASTCTQPYAHQISRLDSLRAQNGIRAPKPTRRARLSLPVIQNAA